MADGVPALTGDNLLTPFIFLNAESAKTAASEGTAGCLGNRHRPFNRTTTAIPETPIRSDRNGYRIDPATPWTKKATFS